MKRDLLVGVGIWFSGLEHAFGTNASRRTASGHRISVGALGHTWEPLGIDFFLADRMHITVNIHVCLIYEELMVLPTGSRGSRLQEHSFVRKPRVLFFRILMLFFNLQDQ